MNNMSGVCVCFPLPCFAAEHALCAIFSLFFKCQWLYVALSLRRLHPTKSDQHALQPVSIL